MDSLTNEEGYLVGILACSWHSDGILNTSIQLSVVYIVCARIAKQKRITYCPIEIHEAVLICQLLNVINAQVSSV